MNFELQDIWAQDAKNYVGKNITFTFKGLNIVTNNHQIIPFGLMAHILFYCYAHNEKLNVGFMVKDDLDVYLQYIEHYLHLKKSKNINGILSDYAKYVKSL